MRPAAVVLALLVGLPLSGCVGVLPDEGEATTLVLRYTLYDTSPTEEARYADPGPHCGTARVDGDRAVVERDALKDVGDARPFLIVLPELEGDWSTRGSEGYPTALTATVDPGIQGEDEPVVVVGWRTEGNRSFATVDGEPVDLPREWTNVHEPGQWRAELRLNVGPDRVDTFQAGLCM